ncbi:MAG: hypothetical protein ACRDCE_16865 [Cetobacterium sp.]|uniref:hypothetical protein n=1 Tax=Cetobacterium sp. TaxID=2071632 RepID=UPI003EE652A8
MYRAVGINEYLKSSLNGELCFSHVTLFPDEYEYVKCDYKKVITCFLENETEKSIDLILDEIFKSEKNYKELSKHKLSKKNYREIIMRKLRGEEISKQEHLYVNEALNFLEKYMKEYIKQIEEKNKKIIDRIRICCFFSVSPEEKLSNIYSKFNNEFHIKNQGMSNKEIILKYRIDNLKLYLLRTEIDKKNYNEMIKSLKSEEFEKILKEYDVLPVSYQTCSKEKISFSEAIDDMETNLIKRNFADKALENERHLDHMNEKNLIEMKAYLLKKHYKFRYENEYRFFKKVDKNEEKRYIEKGFEVETVIFTKDCLSNDKEKRNILLNVLRIIVEKNLEIGILNSEKKLELEKFIIELLKELNLSSEKIKKLSFINFK